MIEQATNIHKTDRGSITEALPEARSLDVHAIPETIGALIAMRTRHGAESAIGHHCTNIMEQLAKLETYVRLDWQKDERQTLQWHIKRQIADLAALT